MSILNPEDINKTIKLQRPLDSAIIWPLIMCVSAYVMIFLFLSGTLKNTEELNFYWPEFSAITLFFIGKSVISNRKSYIELTKTELKIFSAFKKTRHIHLTDIDALFVPPDNIFDSDPPKDIMIIHLRISGVAEEVDLYGLSKTAAQFEKCISARIAALRA